MTALEQESRFYTQSRRVHELVGEIFTNRYTFYAQKMALTRRADDLAMAEMTVAGYDPAQEPDLQRALTMQYALDKVVAESGALALQVARSHG